MKLLISFFALLIHTSMPVNKDPGTLPSNNQDPKPLFTFGIVADVQYADYEPAGTRFYRSSPDKLSEALSRFVTDSVSFVINLGDLIDKDFESYDRVLDIMNASGLKTYHVAGNHDYAVDPQYKNRLPVIKPSREGYYSFVYNKIRFVCLNGNEISTYISNDKDVVEEARKNLTEMKQNGEINAVEWNGGLGGSQTKWLKRELDEAVAAKEKVLLICHFPIAPDNVHNLLNYKDILSVLESYKNIIAWFSGHNHAGNYGYLNMIHFVTFKGMVETESENSFAEVEVYNNKVVIKGYGREKSRIMEY